MTLIKDLEIPEKANPRWQTRESAPQKPRLDSEFWRTFTRITRGCPKQQEGAFSHLAASGDRTYFRAYGCCLIDKLDRAIL